LPSRPSRAGSCGGRCSSRVDHRACEPGSTPVGVSLVFWRGSVQPDAGDAGELGGGAGGDERPGVIGGPGVAGVVPGGEVDEDAGGVQSGVPVEVGQVGGGVGVAVAAREASSQRPGTCADDRAQRGWGGEGWVAQEQPGERDVVGGWSDEGGGPVPSCTQIAPVRLGRASRTGVHRAAGGCDYGRRFQRGTPRSGG
jgi:hypothetical protein